MKKDYYAILSDVFNSSVKETVDVMKKYGLSEIDFNDKSYPGAFPSFTVELDGEFCNVSVDKVALTGNDTTYYMCVTDESGDSRILLTTDPICYNVEAVNILFDVETYIMWKFNLDNV